jgi:hypothetical protein
MEELPLFDKWFDETHHSELVEGEGRACLPVGRGRFSNDYVNSILRPYITAGPPLCSRFKGPYDH